MLAGVKTRGVEQVNLIVTVLHGQVRFPAESVTQGQLWSNSPSVLRVERMISEQLIGARWRALIESAALSGHEVRQRKPDNRAVERVLTIHEAVKLREIARADPVTSERHLVAASGEIEIIRDLVAGRVEESGIGGAGSNAEAGPCDADVCVPGNWRADFHTEIHRREEWLQDAIVVCLADSDVERIQLMTR